VQTAHTSCVFTNKGRQLQVDQHAVDLYAVRTQAAYNNTTEVELEDLDMPMAGEPKSSLYPVGTK
jgi:hypothetical protein